MEATMFTGWIYDPILPHAAAVKVAHPLMLRAIAAAKKKNDRIDASKICDCLRCDFLPEATWPPPRPGSDVGRYATRATVRQNVPVAQQVKQMLMESGVVYNKQKLHKVGAFQGTDGDQPGYQPRAEAAAGDLPRDHRADRQRSRVH